MMKNYDMKSYQKKLKREMDEGRYQHTLGVMYTSAALAMRYEYDIQKAQMAGLLHDCAKCIPNGKKLKLCEKHNIQITEVERRNPFLLHAKLGAFLAMHEYGINDNCHPHLRQTDQRQYSKYQLDGGQQCQILHCHSVCTLAGLNSFAETAQIICGNQYIRRIR